MKYYFTITLFLSSFLLFLIQPMLAKILLPYAGGAAGVWTVTMLFFQILLIAGYGYAMLSTSYCISLTQVRIHAIFYVIACIVYLPLVLRTGSDSVSPEWWIFITLSLTVGFPYFLLAANSSMIQRWYYALYQEEPYHLFSASNAGSFLGLFAYPFIFEWLFDIPLQMQIWGYAFIGLTFLIIGFPLYVISSKKVFLHEMHKSICTLPLRHIGQILFYAFIPSSLFLSTTLVVSTDIASLPLIWIIPLALYLLSMVLVFSTKREYYIKSLRPLCALLLGLFLTNLIFKSFLLGLSLYFIFFFTIAIASHGQLARIRPSPEKLAIYFFWVSVGGALGGLGNLIAACLFNNIYEYYIVVAISTFVLVKSMNSSTSLHGSRRATFAIIVVMILLITGLYLWKQSTVAVDKKVIAMSRNFYGVSKIFETKEYRMYAHGNTMHGIQELDSNASILGMTSYYQPLKELIDILPEKFKHEPLAMIGLGIGTFACAAHKDQEVDFFEINPDIIRIAKEKDYFTYLASCPPKTNIIQGDGRIELAKQSNQRYALLVIDAFSSDSIPMHLITKEALMLYSQKIMPKDGIIAFHVSNKHLDLVPFLQRLSETLGLEAYALRHEGNKDLHQLPSLWYITVSPDFPWKSQLTNLGYTAVPQDSDIPLWTDQYSNILPALIW